jgi:hypothetical protein
MISRSQMNRQLYQMGGEGMQAGIQEDMQGLCKWLHKKCNLNAINASINATSNAINASSFTKSRAATIGS